VVLVPIFSKDQDGIVLEPLDRVLASELIRTQCFEVVTLSRKDLLGALGATQFETSSLLPYDFIRFLKNTYQADAVLMVDLTVYRPYKPMAMGMRAKLISLQTGDLRLLWASDAVYDSGDPRVAMGAKRYQQSFMSSSYPLHQPVSITQSPTYFWHYVVFTSLQALPTPPAAGSSPAG
jgi:hypothetical protein